MASKGEPLHELRKKLTSSHPAIEYILENLASDLIVSNSAAESKTFNDPIWKTISLSSDEVYILDQPLVQRLRHIRQLGLAYLVYPSAHHTRFEHSLGALHISDRALHRLQENTEGGLKDGEEVRRRLRLAALLHDSGHTVFSHIGERALGSIGWVDVAYRAAHQILSEFFFDSKLASSERKTGQGLPYRAPPVAELISTLFLLSPAMESQLGKTGYKPDDLLSAAALIYGRLYKSANESTREIFAYVSNIMSGDLDADKLDYVARDAYFAGIPVAADIDRLLSQIIAVKDHCVLEDGHSADVWRLGIQPAGVATVEMFILTRAYLFSRVYQHPVVRAAERQLYRSIARELERHATPATPSESNLENVFKFFYMPGGDDACLASMKSAASKSLRHDLPKRVLGLTQRNVYGYSAAEGELPPPITALWATASTSLSEPSKLHAIENEIAEIVGGEIYVDWTVPPPIKEDPEIYVRDRFLTGDRPPRLNKYFDMAQMARAYDHVRNMVWVFASDVDPNKASAASASVFAYQLGLVPSGQALKDARIDPIKVKPHLTEMAKSQQLIGVGAASVELYLGEKLAVPPPLVEAVLSTLGPDAKEVSYILCDEISQLNLPATYVGGLQAVLVVLQLCLKYIDFCAGRGNRNGLAIEEDILQENISSFLTARAEEFGIEISEHSSSSSGIYDITVKVGKSSYSTVIELKAEDGTFETVVDRNKGQLFQYMQDKKANVFGVLFCRFRSAEDDRQANFVKVYRNSAQYPSIIFAVGQHVPLGSASSRKGSKSKSKKLT